MTDQAPTTPEPLRIVDDPSERRYEALLGDRVVGFTEYRPMPGRLVFTHTEVDAEFEGRGVAGRLAQGALDDVRARGLKLTPLCPFIASFIRRHPEYDDLVAPPGGVRPG